MNCGNQHPNRNADGFHHVVIFNSVATGRKRMGLSEDHDQVGSCLKIGLVLVCAERSQRIQSLFRGSLMVESVLFLLRSGSNLALNFWIADDNEVPRLHIGAARSTPGGP